MIKEETSMAKFCENCGSPLKEGNKFCENCGAPVPVPATESPAPAGSAVSSAAPVSGASAAAAAAAGAALHSQTASDTPQAFVQPQSPPAPDQAGSSGPQQQTMADPAAGKAFPGEPEAPRPQNNYQGPVHPGRQASTEETAASEALNPKDRQGPPPRSQMPAQQARPFGKTQPEYEPDTDLKSMFLRYDNRLNRKPYLLRGLALWAVVTVISVLFQSIAGAVKVPALATVGTIVSYAAIIPNFMLLIRRLHDLNRPTWWCIGIIIPVINFFLALYVLFFKGTEGPNKFGPDPLEGK